MGPAEEDIGAYVPCIEPHSQGPWGTGIPAPTERHRKGADEHQQTDLEQGETKAANAAAKTSMSSAQGHANQRQAGIRVDEEARARLGLA